MFEKAVQQIENEPWYQDIRVFDDHFIVYVKYMDRNVNERIPQTIENKKVLIHFANSHATKSNYILKDTSSFVQDVEDKKILDILKMRNKFQSYDDRCGMNIVRDIFFEIIDKDNAITNLSSLYPDIRKELEGYYKQYGFEVLYKELGC